MHLLCQQLRRLVLVRHILQREHDSLTTQSREPRVYSSGRVSDLACEVGHIEIMCILPYTVGVLD